MQQNHCDGVLRNDWNNLLGQQISQHTAMSMSRSTLEDLSSRHSFTLFSNNSFDEGMSVVKIKRLYFSFLYPTVQFVIVTVMYY